MFVDPGELDKRIRFIRLIEIDQNGNGFPIERREVFRSCWAKVAYTSGTELLRNNTEYSEAKVRFLVRHTEKEIKTGDIIEYKNKEFNIVYINPYGDSREYDEIWCEMSERAK